MLDRGTDDEAPAPFVVGVSRSGTTLLRLMLDAHPALAIPHETHVLGDLVRAADELSADAVVDIFVGAPTWPNMHLDPADLRAALDALEPFRVADAVRAFYRLYAARLGKPRWGDKTPPYREHLAAIARLLPEAHFIHLLRDGRDVALSYRGLWFGPGDDPADAATFWVDQVRATRAAGQRLDHYLEVRYEDLVTEPERVLRDVCAFIDLPFHPLMLQHERFADQRLAEMRASFGPWDATPVDLERFVAIHQQVRQPVDRTRIGRWRHEMAADDVRAFERVAHPLLVELGYEPVTTREEGHPVG